MVVKLSNASAKTQNVLSHSRINAIRLYFQPNNLCPFHCYKHIGERCICSTFYVNNAVVQSLNKKISCIDKSHVVTFVAAKVLKLCTGSAKPPQCCTIIQCTEAIITTFPVSE